MKRALGDLMTDERAGGVERRRDDRRQGRREGQRRRPEDGERGEHEAQAAGHPAIVRAGVPFDGA